MRQGEAFVFGQKRSNTRWTLRGDFVQRSGKGRSTGSKAPSSKLELEGGGGEGNEVRLSGLEKVMIVVLPCPLPGSSKKVHRSVRFFKGASLTLTSIESRTEEKVDNARLLAGQTDSKN